MQYGIEPELDTLRTMLEPKLQAPDGAQTLASLGQGGQRGFQRSESASVLLFIWGRHTLPVFLTSIRVEEKAYLPSLIAYRANVTLTVQVIESKNRFYLAEKQRQIEGAELQSSAAASPVSGGSF
jgi:hypothetical protein